MTKLCAELHNLQLKMSFLVNNNRTGLLTATTTTAFNCCHCFCCYLESEVLKGSEENLKVSPFYRQRQIIQYTTVLDEFYHSYQSLSSVTIICSVFHLFVLVCCFLIFFCDSINYFCLCNFSLKKCYRSKVYRYFIYKP